MNLKRYSSYVTQALSKHGKLHEYMKPLFSAYSRNPQAVQIINSRSIANSYASKTLVSKPKFSTQ